MPTTSRFRAAAARLKHRSLDPAFLYRQTASMLRSGLPLPQALAFLGDELGARPAAALAAVRARVEAGETFADALSALPSRWVPPEDRAAVAAAEANGRLVDVLEDLAVDRERITATASRIRAAATYPIVVLTLVVAVGAVVAAKVMPTFAALYAAIRAYMPSVGAELPWTARLFIGAANGLWILLAAVVVLVAAWKLGLRDRLLPRLPIARDVVAAGQELRFARLLALLLSAGVRFDEALERCAEAVGGTDARRTLLDAAQRARSGEKPSAILSATGLLSPGFLFLLAGSEERGDFLEVTRAMAEGAEERLAASLDLAQRVVEPVSILLLGAVVGLVVVGVYSPMFKLIELVGY